MPSEKDSNLTPLVTGTTDSPDQGCELCEVPLRGPQDPGLYSRRRSMRVSLVSTAKAHIAFQAEQSMNLCRAN